MLFGAVAALFFHIIVRLITLPLPAFFATDFKPNKKTIMKKIFLLAATAIFSTAAFSQTKWGVQAIGNLSNISITAEGADMFKKSSNIGFGVGVVSDVALGSNLSLRSSLNFLQKGGKLKSDFGEDMGEMLPSIEMDAKLYYAELPVNLVYNVDLSSGRLYFGAGPSLGFGLGGKMKVTSTNPFDPSEKEEEKVDAFKKEDDGGAGLKRLDFSANAIAGYQFKSGLYVNAGYLLGLSNLVDSEDGEKMRNRGLQLTVGYFFGKKK